MAYTENEKSTGLDTLDNSTLANGDLTIIGDVSDSGRAKGITWTNIKAFLKTYFDTLYPSGSGTSTGANTGDQTISDATITTTDITTNNSSTSKHGFLKKLSNSASEYMDGSGNWSTPAGGASSTALEISSVFETTARFSSSGVNGTSAFGTSGVNLNTDGVISSYIVLKFNPLAGSANSMKLFDGSPTFTTTIAAFNANSSGSGSAFVGIGVPTVAGSGHTFTVRHIGFKMIKVSSTTIDLYATQADGTTENASSSLTTIANDDVLELICVVNGATSVAYYWRKNGGSLSSATTLTGNVPSGATSSGSLQWSSSNDATAVSYNWGVGSFSYKR